MQQGAMVEVLQKEALPARERKRLAELEKIILTDLGAFLRVGAALAEISAARLYREEAFTFEEYLAAKWDMGKSRGYQLIDAHEVTKTLSTNCGQIEFYPQNEAQIRPLTKFKDNPEMLEKVWTAAVNSAAEGKVTAKLVQRTIFEITGHEVGKKTGAARAKARKDATVSNDFLAAFEAMVQAIELAKNSGYKNSDRAAMVRHLDTLRHILSEDGEEIADPLS